MNIKIDEEKCIGCGTCAALCPQTFGLNDENKAIVITSEGADEESVKIAAASCPVQAIEIE